MEILTHPNPVLKVSAEQVDANDADLPELVSQMARAMYAAPGLGLAATQVGVLKRVIVYDVDDRLVALCNPRITARSDETVLDEEGCLSVPGISIPIERALTVTCEAFDLSGNPVTIEASDLHARLLQHELDHLDGILILDRAGADERKSALQRYREAQSVG